MVVRRPNPVPLAMRQLPLDRVFVLVLLIKIELASDLNPCAVIVSLS
jgi:hypothetical protein